MGSGINAIVAARKRPIVGWHNGHESPDATELETWLNNKFEALYATGRTI